VRQLAVAFDWFLGIYWYLPCKVKASLRIAKAVEPASGAGGKGVVPIQIDNFASNLQIFFGFVETNLA